MVFFWTSMEVTPEHAPSIHRVLGRRRNFNAVWQEYLVE
jgi:hypothetical protein